MIILLLTNIISLVVTGSVAYIITHDKDIKASEQDGGMKPSSMEFMKMAIYNSHQQSYSFSFWTCRTLIEIFCWDQT